MVARTSYFQLEGLGSSAAPARVLCVTFVGGPHWIRKLGCIGLTTLAACSSTGEEGPPPQEEPGMSTGGMDPGTGGGVPWEASGGDSSASGGAASGGASTSAGGGSASGGFVSLGSGGEPSTGGDPGSGGELGSGGGVGTGGDPGGSGGGEPDDGCEFSGNVTYTLNSPETWPQDARDLITEAMDEAVYYYNCYADLEKQITVDYNSGVPTAQANVDGWLSFGSNTAYMQLATAMHEVAHTLGVGYYPWSELISDGRWVGTAVDTLMNALPASERDPDMYSQRTYITCDSQHFWPYGLNQSSEYQSEWSLINHVRIVAAMNEDKQAFLNQ